MFCRVNLFTLFVKWFGNPLQDSWLESPTDRRDGWTTDHEVAENGTQLSN